MNKPIANKLLDELKKFAQDYNNKPIINGLSLYIDSWVEKLENLIGIMRNEISNDKFNLCMTRKNIKEEYCLILATSSANKYYQPTTSINDLFFSDKEVSNFIVKTRDEILKKQKDNKGDKNG